MCVCVCVCDYLINCEYFNNLNGDSYYGRDMYILILEQVGDSSYSYPYPVNAGIIRQNGDGFK